MYKLLIVDDEKNSRDGLRTFFDWSQYNIEVAGEAEDGIKALALLESLEPHILLTDVSMPRMNGLELSEKAREINPDIKIIFISGYDEVDYLKTALKLDAIDYILKPVDFDELTQVITKVLSIFGGEKSQKELLYSMSSKLLESMPLLRAKFLMTLLRDELENEKEGIKTAEFLELSIPVDGLFCVLIFEIEDQRDYFGGMTERDRQLMSFAVLNVFQELIDLKFKGFALENRQEEYVGLITLEDRDDIEAVLELAEQIQDSLKTYLGLSITIAVGGVKDRIKGINKSYQEAVEAMNHKLFIGKNKILTLEYMPQKEEELLKIDSNMKNKLISMLKNAQEDNLNQVISDIFEKIQINHLGGLNYCRGICLQLLAILFTLPGDLGVIWDEEYESKGLIWEQLMEIDTIEEMEELVQKEYSTLSRKFADVEPRKTNSVVEQVKEIIHKRYGENLTVNDIANAIYLSTPYVCLVFKQETGQTVNDYLTIYRMEVAKKLLAEKKMKLYEISSFVGYSEPGYFSRVFKKYTGVSPSDFKF